MQVGKSFVAQVLARQVRAALHARQAVKHVLPATVARNRVWAMDGTVLPGGEASTHHRIALGIVDHGSRVLTGLRVVSRFNAWTALGVLCLAIGQWGQPARLRTDNAAVFHSRVWRVGLALLGIKRQFTQPGCPWQNGRIERLFGTLKRCWAELAAPQRHDVHLRLAEFAHWYNATRPHQHLQGRTPIQAWLTDGPRVRWRVVHWWGGALRAVRRE
jgi:transposase InsO family protein